MNRGEVVGPTLFPAGLIIDRAMPHKVHFRLGLFYLFLRFPHSDLLSFNHNRGGKKLHLTARDLRNCFECCGCWIALHGALTGLWLKPLEMFSVSIPVCFALRRLEFPLHSAVVAHHQPVLLQHVCHLLRLRSHRLGNLSFALAPPVSSLLYFPL